MARERDNKARFKAKHDLSKKDKLSIIRGILAQRPNFRQYGYNRSVIKLFQGEYNVKLSDSYISELIHEVLSEMADEKTVRVAKGHINDMLFRVYEKSQDQEQAMRPDTRLEIQRRIAVDLAKVNGHDSSRQDHYFPDGIPSTLTPEQEKRIAEEVSILMGKKIGK